VSSSLPPIVVLTLLCGAASWRTVVRNSWQIVAAKKTYTVYAADQDEKSRWVEAMNQVIDALVTKNPSLLGTSSLLLP
jgi:hypothetical protein